MIDERAVDIAPVWRGDAEYYRSRLRQEYTYDRLLDLTCYDYVGALSRNPLLPMTRFADYLSSIWRVSPDAAVADMSRKISGWIEEGLAVLPDEVQALAEQGELDLPFDVVPARALHA